MSAIELPPHARSRDAPSWHRRYGAVFLTLLAIGLGAWSSGLTGPYHFDDFVTPLDDPASQSLTAWVYHLPRTLRPLTKLTYAVEAETAWTSTAAARRVTSMLLHTVTATLLLRLVRRLVPDAPLVATLASAVWFLHPVHADAVLLASGRSALLSGLFVVAALLAADRDRPWLTAVLFALACVSRETALAILLPIAVIVGARRRGTWWQPMRQLIPTLTAAALVVIWILATPRYRQLGEYSILGRPFASSLAAQVGAVPAGFALLFQPASLSIDYGIPLPHRLIDPLFIGGVLMYVGALTIVCVAWRRRPTVAIGMTLWVAALLPTQSAVPKLDALTNRPLSLALAGLVIAIAPLMAAVSRRPRTAWRVASVSAAAMVLLTLVTATASRAALFQSEFALWQDAAAKSRANERPHLRYASLLEEQNRHREALVVLLTASRINPLNADIETMSRVIRSREVTR